MATTPTKPAQNNPPKALRTAKGKKPQYFSDPAIDKLLSIVISMAGELSVTRERLDTVKRLLAEKKILTISEIDHYQPLLFVVDSFEHLFAEVNRLEQWLVEGRLSFSAPGEPVIASADLESFLAARS